MKTSKINARVERQAPQVWTPESKLLVPHEDGEIVFAYPGFGPGNYQNVGKQILEKIPGKDLAIPTGEYTASLLYAAYCDKSVLSDPEFQNIREIRMFNWVFNRKLWTPKDCGELGAGVFSVYDENGVGLSKELKVSQLEEALENPVELSEGVISTQDGKIRFASVSSNYTLGEHTHDSLKTDGSVIADYGINGAMKLSKISRTIGKNPYVYGLNVSKLKEPVQRVSALDGDGGRLRVIGLDFGDYYRCLAFGVLK